MSTNNNGTNVHSRESGTRVVNSEHRIAGSEKRASDGHVKKSVILKASAQAQCGSEERPLPDGLPQTMAVAFLDAKKFAIISKVADARGVEQYRAVEVQKLRHWRDDFYEHRGSSYKRIVREDLRSDVVAFLNSAWYFNSKFEKRRLAVKNSVIADVMSQLSMICHVKTLAMPAWIGDEQDRPSPKDIVAYSNGMVDVSAWLEDPHAHEAKHPSDEWFHQPTHNWFSASSLPRPFSTLAHCPNTFKYLRTALITDDQILLAMEWLGYLITQDNSFEKMMWLHGNGGTGKGTFCKIIADLVGSSNTAAFSFSSLTNQFALKSWMGKTVAMNRDGHLGTGEQAHRIVDTILGVTGRDPQFIDVKNKDPIEEHLLSTRIVVSLNAFPSLPASQTAMERRSLILAFDKQVGDGTDRNLFEDSIKPEMSGVTAAALIALKRLHTNRRFTRTVRGEELIDRLTRLSTPVKDSTASAAALRTFTPQPRL
jgi:hypothetical protein